MVGTGLSSRESYLKQISYSHLLVISVGHMQILFTARHVTIEDGLTDYCEERLQKLARYLEEPATIEVRFEDVRGGAKGGLDRLVCLSVTQPRVKNPFHIEKISGDYRSSFDIARDHLENHLRRQHLKRQLKKRLPRIDKLMFWRR